jgi:hypothetical protein
MHVFFDFGVVLGFDHVEDGQLGVTGLQILEPILGGRFGAPDFEFVFLAVAEDLNAGHGSVPQ